MKRRILFLIAIIALPFVMQGCQKEQRYKVTFESNGGSAVDAISVKEGLTIILEAPTKVGHTFKGWYTSNGYEYEFTMATPVTRDITLYAKWEKEKYTINFHDESGKITSTITKYYDDDLEIPYDLIRKGYDFIGWYKDQDLVEEFTLTKMPAENLNLYPKWERVYIEIKNNGDLFKVIDQLPYGSYKSISRNHYPQDMGGKEYYYLTLNNGNSLFIDENNQYHYMHAIQTSEGKGYVDIIGTYGNLHTAKLDIRVDNGTSTEIYPYSEGTVNNFDITKEYDSLTIKFDYYRNNCNIDKQVMEKLLEENAMEAINALKNFIENTLDVRFK